MIESLNTWIAVFTALIGLGALFAIFGVRDQVRLQSEQMTRDFENLYLQRYWVIMDRIAAADDDGVDAARAADRQRDARLAYLRLCEDQLDLFAAGRVSAGTWVLWASAITAQCSEPEYLRVLDSLGLDDLPSLRRHLGR